MSVAVESDVSDEEWDEFVHSSPGGNFEQTSSWGKLKGLYGWEPLRIVCRNGSQIEGGCQLLVRRVKRVGRIGYLTRGPMTADGHAETLKRVVWQIDGYGRAKRFAYLVVVPPFGGDNPEGLLKSRGFLPKPDEFPPSGLVTADAVLNLTSSLDEILMQMRGSTRQCVRHSARSQACLRQGTVDEIETFRSLMNAICQRRGTAPTPSQPDFFANTWPLLVETGLARFYFVEIDGAIVSAAFVIMFRDRFLLWKIGWSGEFKDQYPNHFLYWELIKLAKEGGFQRFEFGQILPDHAASILRGEKPQGSYAGVTSFKMGFGGEIVESPAVVFKSYLPFAQMVLRAGALQVVTSKRVLGLARSMVRRSS